MSTYSNFRPQQGQPYSNQITGNFQQGYNGHPTQQAYKKASGCSMKDSYTHKSGENKGQESGSHVVWGWKKAVGGGLLKFVAVMAKEPETKLPRWLKMVVTVTPPNAAKFLVTGFWDKQKQRLHIPDMDLIANPNAPNGGYFGRNYKPKK